MRVIKQIGTDVINGTVLAFMLAVVLTEAYVKRANS